MALTSHIYLGSSVALVNHSIYLVSSEMSTRLRYKRRTLCTYVKYLGLVVNSLGMLAPLRYNYSEGFL
jgi:hypothetical protein